MSVAEFAPSPVNISRGRFCGRDSSIVVFVSVSGSVMPIRILESDSIASVKLMIQSCRGLFVGKQKLVFKGRELARNNSRIRDYGVAEGNVLHLVFKKSDLRDVIVRTVTGRAYEYRLERCRNVGYVKKQIAKEEEDLEVKDQEVICNGEKLDDRCLIDDICDTNDAVIHLLVQKSAKVDKSFELKISAQYDEEEEVDGTRCVEPVIVNPETQLSPAVSEMIKSTYAGMERGHQPLRSSEGSGGVYFMKHLSDSKFVSVFKPIDEEPNAVNNPSGLPLSLEGEGLKKGTRVGEGALREVAAYILDHPKNGCRSFSNEEMGFSGVPPTAMVNCLHGAFNHPRGFELSPEHVKVGSLQKFMKNNGSCEDMGPRAFPVEEVHKISVLDIRMANTDRHAGNILMSKEKDDSPPTLIPIDHGYCLPENFEDCTFEWLYWPQSRQPYSPDTIDYIRSLDAEEDIALLKFHGWDLSPECARTLRISTMLLKKGVEKDLTPFAIGNIMCRETLTKESVIEEIIHEAQGSTDEPAFLKSVSRIMDCRLSKLT